MKSKMWGLLVLVLATGLAACSSEQPENETSDLTRDLLAQPAGDGVSTPVAGVPDAAAAQEGPRIAVSMVGINRGEASAPVKVVEMSDYGCGYCRQFHQESFPTIVREFIESGMVEWKFVPYITGMFDNSLVATEAAECTYAQDPAAFEELNARLWGDQRAWKQSSEPEPVVRGWVEETGVDMEAFDSCLASDERLPRIASATTLARQLQVRGTPTFVVIGSGAYPPIQGALPLEAFREILSAVHGEVTEAGETTGGA